MSYCVNCGVELDGSVRACPLCNTPVVNPAELEKLMQADRPFPKSKGEVETVKRKDFGVLLSAIFLATAVTCGILNLFVFTGSHWSLAVIGICVVLWVMLIPAVFFPQQSVYFSLLLDGGAIAAYLYLLTFLTKSSQWFPGLGMPIVVLVTVVAEIFTFCVRNLPRSFLTVSLYLYTAVGVFCMGLEILIDRYLTGHIALSWSAVVVTVCAILDIAIITMLSQKRLRNAARRRFHF